eukprot:16430807-Heterocapsa_arctica.AAC.1
MRVCKPNSDNPTRYHHLSGDSRGFRTPLFTNQCQNASRSEVRTFTRENIKCLDNSGKATRTVSRDPWVS